MEQQSAQPKKHTGKKATVVAVLVILIMALSAAAGFLYYAGPNDEMEIALPVPTEDTADDVVEPVDTVDLDDPVTPGDDDTPDDGVDDSTDPGDDVDGTDDDVPADPPADGDITILAPDDPDDGFVHPGVIPTTGTYSYSMYANSSHLSCGGPSGGITANGTAYVEFVTDGYQALVDIDGQNLVFNAINAFDTLYYQTDPAPFSFRMPDDSIGTGEVKFWLQPQTESEIDFWIDWDNKFDCSGFYPAKMELL